MSDAPRHDALIDALGAQLTPVRRLPPPWLRTLGWLAVVAAIAAVLLQRYGAHTMLHRWQAAPDLCLAAFGAVTTAITAALAAFALAVPGRSIRWALLPVPSAVLWISASGMGCLRAHIPGMAVLDMREANHCLMFIISFSIPLSGLLIWLLRRAYPLRPVLTAVIVGLASAAASASLLEICHNVDAAASDLVMHALAVAIVVVANMAMGGRLLTKA
ncbi:MAG TPA: NrsF family protein [Dyella sp.]|uniref:NrsF family protein n=1 Tax=Dyella sp. TaxID=1869338 RepID=UPI002B86D1FF|nr:NrsF family protein [Dyella sp.]HTV85725.1 NrsF family protein [Dyella sp.]